MSQQVYNWYTFWNRIFTFVLQLQTRMYKMTRCIKICRRRQQYNIFYYFMYVDRSGPLSESHQYKTVVTKCQSNWWLQSRTGILTHNNNNNNILNLYCYHLLIVERADRDDNNKSDKAVSSTTIEVLLWTDTDSVCQTRFYFRLQCMMGHRHASVERVQLMFRII